MKELSFEKMEEINGKNSAPGYFCGIGIGAAIGSGLEPIALLLGIGCYIALSDW